MTRSVAWLPLLCLTLLSCPALAGGGPENVLVLANDASSESLEVAHYYMHRRGVPRHHIVHLNLDKKHWGYIRPFSTYLTEVEQPVKAWLAANKSSHITTLVLSRDVPVTVELIMPEPRPKKLRDRNRSVAHMLAVMDVDRAEFRQAGKSWRRSGNPYNGRDRSIDFRQPLDLPLQKYALYCAGTINAFSVSDSKKLVDRAIASERERPTGTVYLSQSRAKDPRGCYNKHFPTLAKILEEWGFKSEVIPHPGKSKALLTGKQDVLAYQYGQAGWAKTFPGQNTYALGALVDNVTSVALTSGCFNPKRKGGQTSMCHFIAAGASAVHGCVAEPYTVAFNARHIHLQRYLSGYNLIESYYMAHPVMPWMNLIAGDPLMQPFAQRPIVTIESLEGGTLKASAKATRSGAAIAHLTLYRDGQLVQRTPGASASFDLGQYDPQVQTLVVVATDDSKYRAQGRVVRTPVYRAASTEGVRFIGFAAGKARLQVSSSPVVYSWYAPGGAPRRGTAQGSTLELKLEARARNTLEVWVHADPTGAPAVKLIDLDGILRDHEWAAAKRARSGDDLVGLAGALIKLAKMKLSAAKRQQVDSWKQELDSKLGQKWAQLGKSAKATVDGFKRLSDFARRYQSFDVGQRAKKRLAGLRAEVDTLAEPLWHRAEQLRQARDWSDALAAYRTIVSRFPVAKQAELASGRIQGILADPAAQKQLAAVRHKQAAERLYRLAVSYKVNGLTAPWKKNLKKLIELYPETKQARQAKRDLEQD